MTDFRSYFTNDYLKRLELLNISNHHRPRGQPGDKRSKGHGLSMEFSDFKHYDPGDDVRRIDQRAYARTGRLYIKRFEDERAATINIFLDTSSSMDFGGFNKLLFGKIMAASLAYICLKDMDSLNIYTFSGSVTKAMGLSGKSGFSRVVDFLDNQKVIDKAELSDFSKFQAKSGLTYIISDFYFENVLNQLKLLGDHRIIAAHLLSAEEISPEIGNFRFHDIENNNHLDVSVNDNIKKQYESTLLGFREEIRQSVTRLGGRYVFIPTEESPNGLRSNTMLKALGALL